MNNKLVKAALAGAAVVALAAGGTTFAAWSDFANITGNQAAAGHLKLSVNSPGVDATQNPLNLAPGENKFVDYYIASNDGTSVPDGELSITLNNLTDTEDGCTTNSEEAIDDCHNASAGDFSSEARIEIIQYGPSATGQCSNVSPLPVPSNVVQNFTYLKGMNNVKLAVVQLAPGEATCVRAIVQLNKDGGAAADNKVQGDSAKWDFHFDLDQV